MISTKEHWLYEKIRNKYNSKNFPNLKYKKDGTLDMRYTENIRLFSKEYKNMLLLENRKYNDIYDGFVINYREELLQSMNDNY
tara:strand:+ start:309 stop:557 length:249 start_codon:yes stop_codon:yes gene_type:complete